MHHAETPSTDPHPRSDAPHPLSADEPAGTSPLLLAYGTLREGVPTYLDTVLPHLATVTRGIRVPGRLFDVVHYPAAVLDSAALSGAAARTAPVTCDLVTITDTDIPVALAALDHYEALDEPQPMYARVPVSLAALGLAPHVATDGATWHTAWFYTWIAATDDLAEVRTGEWTAGGV